MTAKEFKDYLVNQVYKNEFKKLGFNTTGTTYVKKETGFITMFNIQSSQFNIGEQFGYYINIGIFFPEAYNFRFGNFYGDEVFEIPSKPKISHCQFNMRASEIFNTSNGYHIDSNTDKLQIEKTVIKEIENTFVPFFCSLKNIEDCIQFIKEKTKSNSCEVWAALTYASLGQFTVSENLILRYIESENPDIKSKQKIYKAFLDKGLTLNILPEDEEKIDISKGSYP